MAMGLGNSWGISTENEISRKVSRAAMPQSLASRFHYKEGRTAADIYNISDNDWSSITKDVVSRDEVADYMRAYEHYQ